MNNSGSRTLKFETSMSLTVSMAAQVRLLEFLFPTDRIFRSHHRKVETPFSMHREERSGRIRFEIQGIQERCLSEVRLKWCPQGSPFVA